jgi:hypothetical protein
MRILLFCLGLIASSLWSVCPSLALKFSSSPPLDKFSQQGTELRAELERVYRDPKGKRDSLRGVDVSSTIARYIPIGTSFEDAERILIAAGFTMASRPPRPLDRDPAPGWEKALRFTMGGGLVLDRTLFTSITEVGVTLSPDLPGDPKAHVKEIHASLRTTYL